jgi:hypothetical protein
MKCKQIPITISVLLFSLQLAAQDLIYKKSGEIITAKILKTYIKSIEYQITGQADNSIHYLTVSGIDSIRFQNGEKQIFPSKLPETVLKVNNTNPVYNHHLVGADLFGLLFYHNITLSYEYLPGKAIVGFKVALSKNIKSRSDYYYYPFNFTSITDWNCRLGINAYFFAPRTFRLGGGLYYIFGSYPIENYYYDPSTSTSKYEHETGSMSGVVISVFGFYNITKNLAFNLGMDFPSFVSPDSQSVLRCELFLNF